MNRATDTMWRTRWALLVAVLVIAFALRISHIDQQSIWYDEGLSIYYARGDVGEILRSVSGSDHPPLHPLLLHLWMALCGDSELSARMLSAWWGVVAVALVYRLAKRLSPATGILSALLIAVSPFAIWYSQEVRGYTVALALVTGAADVTLGLFPTQAPRPWWRYVAYVLLAVAAVYTHFYSGFALLALNIAYVVLYARLIVYAPRERMHFFRWVLAQAVVLAAFAPWVPVVVSQIQINATYWHGTVDWQQIVRSTLRAFSVGTTLVDGWATAAAWAASLLALIGTLALTRRRRDRAVAALSWIWYLVPLLILIAINRTRPKFSPRYLMNALPPFLILAAAGTRHLFQITVRRTSTWQGWAAATALLFTVGMLGGGTARSLANHYLDQRLYRPDFRAVARYIQDHASPDDLIVLVGGHSYPAFTYYYRDSLPVLPLPDQLLPTTQRPIDQRALQALDSAIEGRQTLWLVLWQESLADPTGLTVDTIEQTYHRLGVGTGFHHIALLAFDVSPGPLLSDSLVPQVAMRADLGQNIRFLGYSLSVNSAHPGDTLYLYLYWDARPGVSHDYKVFAQILDESGQIVAQHDKIAGAASYPTSHWTPGHTVRDRFLLTISSDAEPGRYSVIAGLYNPGASKARLPVVGEGAQGDYMLLSEIQITPK